MFAPASPDNYAEIVVRDRRRRRRAASLGGEQDSLAGRGDDQDGGPGGAGEGGGAFEMFGAPLRDGERPPGYPMSETVRRLTRPSFLLLRLQFQERCTRRIHTERSFGRQQLDSSERHRPSV